MKKPFFLFLPILAGLVLMVTPVYAQNRLTPKTDLSAIPGQRESEITVNYVSGEHPALIYVDGQLSAQNDPGTLEKIIVMNGEHSIEVVLNAWNVRSKKWMQGDRQSISCRPQSNSITIEFDETITGVIRGLRIAKVEALNRAGPRTVVQGTTAAPANTGNTDDIEGALSRAGKILVNELPDGATIAVISIATQDRNMAEFVIEEITYILVHTGYFRMVDRRSLDAIRDEQNFQMSGEVDDNSAVSIGNKLGANIVITGSMSGEGVLRRLRVKALDVRTAEIVAMASEAF
ncbi:CsgG/HfaB family protein [Treponema primitia]|uniref:CsgG/HfaB family protein n=1 Tax=Treponema primitia TaxID=88058 RepID=UPI00398128DD